ncbi:hypothetical protein GGR56DRAFT_292219 [Xylariaceae sp. FL0804]|nr:hypothetical protein GGR56DRAFT_292219 [Xylariaceae sp. FL0804]
MSHACWPDRRKEQGPCHRERHSLRYRYPRRIWEALDTKSAPRDYADGKVRARGRVAGATLLAVGTGRLRMHGGVRVPRVGASRPLVRWCAPSDVATAFPAPVMPCRQFPQARPSAWRRDVSTDAAPMPPSMSPASSSRPVANTESITKGQESPSGRVSD